MWSWRENPSVNLSFVWNLYLLISLQGKLLLRQPNGIIIIIIIFVFIVFTICLQSDARATQWNEVGMQAAPIEASFNQTNNNNESSDNDVGIICGDTKLCIIGEEAYRGGAWVWDLLRDSLLWGRSVVPPSNWHWNEETWHQCRSDHAGSRQDLACTLDPGDGDEQRYFCLLWTLQCSTIIQGGVRGLNILAVDRRWSDSENVHTRPGGKQWWPSRLCKSIWLSRWHDL